MLRSNLSDYSDAYILVKGTITDEGTNDANKRNKKLQFWPKYMRQTLELVWNIAVQKKFNFNFWTVFC